MIVDILIFSRPY